MLFHVNDTVAPEESILNPGVKILSLTFECRSVHGRKQEAQMAANDDGLAVTHGVKCAQLLRRDIQPVCIVAKGFSNLDLDRTVFGYQVIRRISGEVRLRDYYGFVFFDG